MTLLQMHWQYPDGHSDFRAQAEIKTQEAFWEWVTGVRERHPLPDGCNWLICEEGARNFMLAAESEAAKDQTGAKP